MAEPVPAGSDVSSGTYRCTSCGNEIDVSSTKYLPPCPNCGNGEWASLERRRQRAGPVPEQLGRPQRPDQGVLPGAEMK